MSNEAGVLGTNGLVSTDHSVHSLLGTISPVDIVFCGRGLSRVTMAPFLETDTTKYTVSGTFLSCFCIELMVHESLKFIDRCIFAPRTLQYLQ